MAVMTLGADSALDNQPAASASAEAFMRAFREFRRLDDADGNFETPEFQLAMYAFEGAKERALFKTEDHDEAALAALVAFDKAQLIIDGGFTIGGGRLADEDERAELVAIQQAVKSLWRYHDRAGGKAARPFAKYVGAAEQRDLVAWQEGR